MLFNRLKIAAATLVPLLVLSGWTGARRGDASRAPVFAACEVQALSFGENPDPPVYYAIDLVTTRKIRGARRATGTGNLTFARSPFGVAISKSGHYVYDLSIALGSFDAPMNGKLVAWVTSTDLSDIRLLGELDDQHKTRGRVDFTKFLVVVTLEPAGEDVGESWSGPVVLRGMSRSGMMHTKAGHGPFQVENCASYGYS